MYIIYPVIEQKKQRNNRLGVVYRNVRVFMLNRGVVFSNGYFVPDQFVPECLDKLAQYKQSWIQEGGAPDCFNVLQFELLCNDLPTYQYCCAAVRKCCFARMQKTYDGIKSKVKFTDIRHLRGVIMDIAYAEPFAGMFKELAGPVKLMQQASLAFPTDREEGLRLYAKAMELLRAEDKE